MQRAKFGDGIEIGVLSRWIGGDAAIGLWAELVSNSEI
ncbi:unnamed protein product [Acidithrix sp. C25]|nr:unnamed protein product [Acidithrix sp. C25]